MRRLFLPPTVKPSGAWLRNESFRNDVKKKTSWNNPSAKPKEHPGRKIGKPAGGWIDDLVALKKALILCWRCQPKFDHKRHHYYKDERFPYVIGKCDGCREHFNHQTKLYIHESYLSDSGGRTKSGQCWTPM